MAAWALESTIHDTGAAKSAPRPWPAGPVWPALPAGGPAVQAPEDALCQHRSQQRQLSVIVTGAELQKRLLVFHKIEVQHLRDGDGAQQRYR